MKLIFSLLLIIASISAFAQTSVKDVEKILNNGRYRQMKVLGTVAHLGDKSCKDGDGYFTFYKDNKVLVESCKNLSWFEEEKNYKVKEENNDFVVYIDEISFIFKKLPATAPVCEGEKNCIRLSAYANSKDEYTTDIYLTF